MSKQAKIEMTGLGMFADVPEQEDGCSQLLGSNACLTWSDWFMYSAWMTAVSWLETFIILISYGALFVGLWWLITFLTDRFISFDLESEKTGNKDSEKLEKRLKSIDDEKAMIMKKLDTDKKRHTQIKSSMLELEKTVELKEKALQQIYISRRKLEEMQMEYQTMRSMVNGLNPALENEPSRDFLCDEIRQMEGVLDEAKLMMEGFKCSVPSDAENKAMKLLTQLMKLKKEEENIQNMLVKMGVSNTPAENPWGKNEGEEEWLDVMIKEFTQTNLEGAVSDGAEKTRGSLNQNAKKGPSNTDTHGNAKKLRKSPTQETEPPTEHELEQHYMDMILKEELEACFQQLDFDDTKIVTGGAKDLQTEKATRQSYNEVLANESMEIEDAESISDSNDSLTSERKVTEITTEESATEQIINLRGLDEQCVIENAENVHSDDEDNFSNMPTLDDPAVRDFERVVEFDNEVVLRLPPAAVIQTSIGKSQSQERIKTVLQNEIDSERDDLMIKIEEVNTVETDMNTLKSRIKNVDVNDQEAVEAAANVTLDRLAEKLCTVKAELEDMEGSLQNGDKTGDISSQAEKPPTGEELSQELSLNRSSSASDDGANTAPKEEDSVIEDSFAAEDSALLHEELQQLGESMQDSRASLMQDLLSAEDLRKLDDSTTFTGDSFLNDSHTGVRTEIEVQDLGAAEDDGAVPHLPESYLQHHAATAAATAADKNIPTGAYGDMVSEV